MTHSPPSPTAAPLSTSPPSSLYKRLLDNTSTALLLVDHNLVVTYLNPAAEMLLASSRSRLIGRELADIFHEPADPDALAAFHHALATGHPYTKREAHLELANLTQATVDYSVIPLLEPGHATALLVEMQALDRLLRISREEQLISQHHATRALVRGIAHEVKNPLGGIRGAAQLLARELQDGTQTDYTNIIIEEVDRLRNLVDRMLGPRTLPQRRQVNVHECLERVRTLILAECENTAYPAQPLRILRDYDLSLPELHADPEQLIQAILNIVRNAMQALLENAIAAPVIILRSRVQRQFTIGSTLHRLAARIEIIDNGPGIPADMIENIFYPMVSGRADGSGLGLSIAQAIINQLGGLIECSSVPGRTLFSLLIPIDANNDKTSSAFTNTVTHTATNTHTATHLSAAAADPFSTSLQVNK